jgi:TfoX/Sxy family transcriptional regulator of competence genes
MAFDEGLAQRIHEVLGEREGIEEKRMFGGMAIMLNGNMAVGVIKDELCVRRGPDAYERLLGQPGARVFDFTERPSKGMLIVNQDTLTSDDDLAAWVQHGIDYAASLPAK